MPLRTKDLCFDPRKQEFKDKNKRLLDALAKELRDLRTTYKGTPAADESLRIARRWDVEDRLNKPKK